MGRSRRVDLARRLGSVGVRSRRGRGGTGHGGQGGPRVVERLAEWPAGVYRGTLRIRLSAKREWSERSGPPATIRRILQALTRPGRYLAWWARRRAHPHLEVGVRSRGWGAVILSVCNSAASKRRDCGQRHLVVAPE